MPGSIRPKICAVRFLPIFFLAVAVLAVPARARADGDFDDCTRKADPDLAVAACTRAIDSHRLTAQDLAASFLLRAVAYQAKGDYDHAIEDCDQAIQLNPRYALAFHSRGIAYRSKRDFERAIQDFDEAIRIKKDFGRAFFDRAVAYESKGDYGLALKDYDRAIQLEKLFPPALDARGMLYLQRGDYARGVQDFDRAIRLVPQDSLALFHRGVARFDLGRFDAAAADFAAAAQSERRNPERWLWLHLAQARAGQDAPQAINAAGKLDLEAWPGPVLSFYQGAISREALLQAARNSDPPAQSSRPTRKSPPELPGSSRLDDRLCQAHFHLAEFEFLHGDRPGALADFQAAAGACPVDLGEYGASRAELARLAGK